MRYFFSIVLNAFILIKQSAQYDNKNSGELELPKRRNEILPHLR